MDNKIFILKQEDLNLKDLNLNNISNILDTIDKPNDDPSTDDPSTDDPSTDESSENKNKEQIKSNNILVESTNNSNINPRLSSNIFSNINENIKIDIINKENNDTISKNNRITDMINGHLDSIDSSPHNSSNTSENGWDNDAKKTLINWYEIFKYDSFVYQYILDRSTKISEILNVISIISSTVLGIFSGFKLWIDNDNFQVISNIMLMLFNFIVALITTLSKRYIDEKRNDGIKLYIRAIDELLGEISAQALKTPNYRINADTFFKDYNDKYTKLITTAPNLTIDEIKLSKKAYKLYMNEVLN